MKIYLNNEKVENISHILRCKMLPFEAIKSCILSNFVFRINEQKKTLIFVTLNDNSKLCGMKGKWYFIFVCNKKAYIKIPRRFCLFSFLAFFAILTDHNDMLVGGASILEKKLTYQENNRGFFEMKM